VVLGHGEVKTSTVTSALNQLEENALQWPTYVFLFRSEKIFRTTQELEY